MNSNGIPNGNGSLLKEVTKYGILGIVLYMMTNFALNTLDTKLDRILTVMEDIRDDIRQTNRPNFSALNASVPHK